MKLTREQFDNMVRGVEERFARDPGGLRMRVAALAVLGYAGLLAPFLAAAGLAALFFSAMFFTDTEGRVFMAIIGTLILLASAWGTFRVLLQSAPAPAGPSPDRATAPALYEMIDELRQTLQSAPFHEVQLSADFNACVIQNPRLGVFGWHRNYLVLGLPLLEQISPEEARALVAHESAHLSKAHGRFGQWIYRLRRSWEHFFERLAQPQAAGTISARPLIQRFVDWYWPRFNAHAFVFSRSNEYEADAVAAGLAGPGPLVTLLKRLDLQSRHLAESFWPTLWKEANTRSEPPDGVLERMRLAMRQGPGPEESARWMEEAFQLVANNSDTHPSLTDRLRALGQDSAEHRGAPGPVSRSAAEAYLGPALDPMRTAVETQWRTSKAADWRDRHARAAALHDRLSRIDSKGDQPADADKLWDRARVLMDLQGDTAATPLLREVLGQQPGHPSANFHLGRILLDAGDASGEAHLENAIDADPDWIPAACSILHQYFQRLGREDKLREITARVDRHEQHLADSRAERSSVSATDTFIPHELSPDQLAGLCRTLASEPQLARAYVGRKALRHFPDQKLFLICVTVRRRWYGLADSDAASALVARLSKQVRLPGRVLVFAPTGSFRAIARKVCALQDSLVHQRGGTG